jgi:hypothetical protein
MKNSIEKSVYKISSNLTESENDRIYNSLSRENKKKISELNDIVLNNDVIDEFGHITSYMVCDKDVIDFIVNLFNENAVSYKVEDITKLFLYGQVEIEDKDFQNFLKENLDIDTILDKINEIGINSLTDLDKKILSK